MPAFRLSALLAAWLVCLLVAAGPALAKRTPKASSEDGTDGRADAMAAAWLAAPEAQLDRQVVTDLAGLGDRSTGSAGCQLTADALEAFFRGLGASEVGRLVYQLPVMRHGPAYLTIPGREDRLEISPLALNALSPGAIPAEGLTGPLVAAGQGDYRDFNGTTPRDAIALLDLDSGRNWQAAAQLGAKALLYEDHAAAGVPIDRGLFADKFELTPVRFPRFLVSAAKLRAYLGDDAVLDGSPQALRVEIRASAHWENVLAEDVHVFFPGTDPALAGQILLVDAPYDATAFVPGRAPGADEAASVAALLRLARHLAAHPPARPVMLVAVSGHGQAQAGLREFFAALRAKGKDLRSQLREAKEEVRAIGAILAAVDALPTKAPPAGEAENAPPVDWQSPLVRGALVESLKDAGDAAATALMRLRLAGEPADAPAVAELAEHRATLRRILWREEFRNLPEDEEQALRELVSATRARLREARASVDQSGSGPRARQAAAAGSEAAKVASRERTAGNSSNERVLDSI